MASPEENLAAALERAEKFRSQGDLERAAVWEASADRYRRLIEIKARLAQSKENIEAIKAKLNAANNATVTPAGSSGTITSGPNNGWYQHVTSRPSAACPSGHERVRVTFMDGVETNVESLGCLGGEVFSGGPGNISDEPVVPRPTPPTPPPPPPPPPPVKTAPIDTILFPNDEALPIEIMADLIFENIGGQELINISRNDTVNGQPISYQPIKNIALIQQSYNPTNILSLQQTSDKIFSGFAIKQDSKVPAVGNGPNGGNVYRDSSNGNIIIELVNMESNEQVDVQFTTNGTIYEVNL